MTKFNVGDRVRVISPVFEDPQFGRHRVAVGATGVVVSTRIYVGVNIDGMTGDRRLFTDNEIELAPAPSLADDLRAKASAKRAEADAVRKEAEEAGRALDELTDRANTLARAASALTVAANVLEEENA